jgi:hypothetical protein
VIDDLIDIILNNNFMRMREQLENSKNKEDKITYLFLNFIYSIISSHDSVEESKNIMAQEICPMIFQNHSWNQQEDAAEFLIGLLNALQTSYGTIIENIFRIQISETYKYTNANDYNRCTNKKGPDPKIVSLYSLELPIVDEKTRYEIFDKYDGNQLKLYQEQDKIIHELSKEKTSLNLLIRKYFQKETITDYDCGGYRVNVDKNKEIIKSSPWLIISFKIFIQESMTNFTFKLENKIDIPDFFNGYELKAISAHSGILRITKKNNIYENKSNGHYIAYVKMDNNKWNLYNDSIVETYNSLQEILNKNTNFTPYILFYKKITN